MAYQTRPREHTPPPVPRSEALLRRADSTPALNQPPVLFALGCDLVEECVAEVSKARAEGIK